MRILALLVAVLAVSILPVAAEEDAAAGLAADGCLLLAVLSPCQQHAALPRAGRSQEDPPPSPTQRRILHHFKAESAGVELESFLVVPDEEGDGADCLLHILAWRRARHHGQQRFAVFDRELKAGLGL